MLVRCSSAIRSIWSTRSSGVGMPSISARSGVRHEYREHVGASALADVAELAVRAAGSRHAVVALVLRRDTTVALRRRRTAMPTDVAV
ncbi:hypothetical protein [Actinophytocola gossypii]|uniref:PPM-type phosphatase domain-containing protein n=1 Tax=Actinophytocola gossypii TaxID=2812003 RepID=A0ABT2JA25_9PSEU|nr:hypothetical protein [Actinophytocola gossypii]MCT2584561.1 hypothetical protein [Actinophytocola gossypii]